MAQSSDWRTCGDSVGRKALDECMTRMRPASTVNGPNTGRSSNGVAVSITKPPVKLSRVPSFARVIW